MVLDHSQTIIMLISPMSSTAIYTLSLHDALPIYVTARHLRASSTVARPAQIMLTRRNPPGNRELIAAVIIRSRSEEHTSELQSHHDLVCRLLLEKKKNKVFCSLHVLITLSLFICW